MILFYIFFYYLLKNIHILYIKLSTKLYILFILLYFNNYSYSRRIFLRIAAFQIVFVRNAQFIGITQAILSTTPAVAPLIQQATF